MEVQISWLAVGLATLASMVVGSIWYAPPVFGKMWMKLIGKTPKEMEKNGWTPILIAVAVSALMAYILAHFSYLSFKAYGGDYSFLASALMTSFWAWLGFTAVRFVTHDSFEGRPLKLTLLNIAHELVTFMAMGLIIGLVGTSGSIIANYSECVEAGGQVSKDIAPSSCIFDGQYYSDGDW